MVPDTEQNCLFDLERFSVEFPFYFEIGPMREFIANLDEMDKNLEWERCTKTNV